jgi:hypothetical protein
MHIGFEEQLRFCFEGIYLLFKSLLQNKYTKTFPSNGKTITFLSCVSDLHTKNDIVRSFVSRYINIFVMKVKQVMNIGK